MPSSYLDSQKAVFYDGKHLGERMGQQQVLDATMIYLKRLGWSSEQVIAYYHGMNAILDEFAEAFAVTQEQDVIQDRMDRELGEVVPDCLPFCKRYPEIKRMGYEKP